MRRRLLSRYVVPAALLPVVLSVVLAGCSSDGPDEPAATSTPSESPSVTTSPSDDATPSPTPSDPTSSAAPSGGTADQPEALSPTTSPLDWEPVSGSIRRSVTRSVTDAGEWTLSVTGASAVLMGPDKRSSGIASSGRRVSDALLDDEYAVVVLQDKAEERPAIARITELATGKTSVLDGRSDLPTANGGTWALDGGTLVHATYSRGSYCLATVDLASGDSTLGWCAPKRNGFSNAQVTPAGTAMMTFDDSQPACRTVVGLDGTEATPFPGVSDCNAWDAMLLDDGAIWSVVPQEQKIEAAHFYGRAGDGYFDLGPGTSGTLEWCDGASYFVRDPQRNGDPAALMRWSAQDGLTVAYESPAGQSFLERPRCGGNTLTVTAYAESGDEQVTVQLR